MQIDGLVIPELLQAMLVAARWPRNADEASKQLLRSLVPDDRIRRFRGICLYPPPFQTVARTLAGGGDRFYTDVGALHELVPDAAIPIADFGMGADSPILLDYRAGPTNPRVISLEWPGGDDPNYWIVLAPDFPSFVEMLGL